MYVPAVATFQGRVLHETFVVDEPIGEGGMGIVYSAHNSKTPGIRYAIKVLRVDTGQPTEEELQRFRREAQALAALDHPAIVRPIHVDVTSEGEPYLVMELVRGRSLRAHVQEATKAGRKLPLAFVVAVLDGISDALDHAHSRGIVHRDLKPENVLITEAGRAVMVKVLDFGIAKIFHPDGRPADTITKTSEVAGTVSYMSPEQCRDLRQAGAASDRFTLGSMAWELLMGLRPFDGANAAATICKILLDPIPSACAERPDLPESVDDVLLRACHKDPAQRYATAAEFVTALAEAFGPLLTTGPVSVPGRTGPNPAQAAADASARVRTAPTNPGAAPSANPGAYDRTFIPSTNRARASTGATNAPPERRRLSGMMVVVVAALLSGATVAAYWRYRVHQQRPRPVPARTVDVVPCPGRAREPTPGLYDDEVCIPGGTFRMGSSAGEGDHDEHPVHRVRLAPFFVDRYEVTLARYRRCVQSGACDARGLGTEGPYDDHGDYAARGTHYRNSPRCTYRDEASGNESRPINCLSFVQAEQLCRFEGRRLPSEAEWERTARGAGNTPRAFPWGDESPDCNHAAYGYGGGCGLAEVPPVGSARAGATPDGVYDLAGSVAEWTADWYAEDYYSVSPTRDPPGATIDAARSHHRDPLVCQDGCRVTRGGAWITPLAMSAYLRGAHRTADAINRRAVHLGMRCVRSS